MSPDGALMDRDILWSLWSSQVDQFGNGQATRCEAERAKFPVTLMGLDELVDALTSTITCTCTPMREDLCR